MSQYASFQGRVYLGKRDTDGNPIETRTPGNVANLGIALKTDVIEHYESTTGQRGLDARIVKQKNATISLTIEEFTKENLALALYGTYQAVTSGSVTAEVISATTPTLGDRYFLAHQKVSTVVITDSAGTPATLVAGTHYTVDEGFGAITFLDVTSFTAPIKCAYAFGAVTDVSMFTAALPERYLRLEGMNTADSNKKVMVELYRVAFDPLKDLSLITDDLNKFELEGSLLADTTKDYDAVMGQFGRLVLID